MIRLGDMQMAREILRQQVELEILTGARFKLDLGRAVDSLRRHDYADPHEHIRRMREALEGLDPDTWGDLYHALLPCLTDDQYADYNLLNTTYTRLIERLEDRAEAAVRRGAAFPDDPTSRAVEFARIAVGIVETTGAALTEAARSAGYRYSPGWGGTPWRTRHERRLDMNAGIGDEMEAFVLAEFSPSERARLDDWFSKNLPPLGMAYTFAASVADAWDRYRVREHPGADSVAVAVEDAFGLVINAFN